ncbi:MAG: hypothetical protein Q8K75_00520 [Chlamydiales bacterium]|nr:hypothetical protein [Chlamydiales bacterium]
MRVNWLIISCMLMIFFVHAGDITKPDGYDYKGGEADYHKMSDCIVSNYIRSMPREIQVIGTGGSFTGEVRYVRTMFCLTAKASVTDARKIVVPEVMKLISAYNSDRQIRPFLHDYPFTYKNAAYSLSFRDKYGNYYSDGSVALVTIHPAGIAYSKHNPATEQLEEILAETWEEALEALNGQTDCVNACPL